LSNILKDKKQVFDPPQFCPYHPDPVPLPSPLPDKITDALLNLTATVKQIINDTTAVSEMYTKL